MKLIFEQIDYDLDSLLLRITLNEFDKQRLDSISNPKRKCEWLMSRVLVWEHIGKNIKVRQDDAPMITDGYISISHCESYITVIINDRPVGIDIENIERNADRLVRKFTNERELNLIREFFPKNPSLFIWCAKEVMYKLAGVEGADFCRDFTIDGFHEDVVDASVFGRKVILNFFVRDNILCVFCLDK